MSPWPFDRLLGALEPLCERHEVFVQVGPSAVRPPCESVAFLPFGEVLGHLRSADIVITHAGNTVRLVQRLGKVPIAVAREAVRGEMANDHQVDYLRMEEASGRVVAVWDMEELPRVVREHATTEARLLAERALPAPAEGADLVRRLDELCLKWVR